VRVTLSELAWMLTALAAVVVLLTRIRLASPTRRPAGRSDFSKSVLTTHTAAGVVALLLWVPGLLLTSVPLAVLGVLAWWVVAAAGLLLLARWLPSGGRHAGDVVTDEWSQGPGLSMLAHLGMLVGALVFTWIVLAQSI
jgi:hypothetical protein